MYTIEGTISQEDYLNANRLHRKRKGIGLIIRILLYIALGLEIPLLVILSLISRTWTPFIVSLILLGLIVFFIAYLPYRVKKIYQQQKELHLPFTMTLDEAGVHFKNQIGESNRPWNIFMRWKEDKNLIMLYHSDLMFSILSKRYLNEEMIKFVHEQLKKNNIPEK